MAGFRVTSRLTIPESEIEVSFSRSSGPGGQHVNKVESRVQVRWVLTTSAAVTEADRAWLLDKLRPRLTTDGVLIISCDRTRNQSRNRREAEARLCELVRDALHRPKIRRATKQSRGSKERRLKHKRENALRKKMRGRPTSDD